VVALAVIVAGCWIKNIDTPYYTQETSYWCGAASAQMVLGSEKIDKYVSQTTLYGYINPRNVCTGWASGPQALADALNHWYPAGHFFVSALSDQDDAVKKIAYTIERYGVPPVSLIYGCGHWVVLRGAYTDVQPTTSSSYTIHGFWVNDPWYGSTSLGENQYVDVSYWRSSYFTGCDWCAREGTRYISVVDPDPPPTVQVVYPRVRPRQDRIVGPDRILEYAREYREQFVSLADRDEQFTRAREALERTEMATPILVRRSDRKDAAYYIVPLNRGEKTSAAVLLDAYSGQLLGASYAPRPIRYLADLEQEPARDLFERRLPTLEIRPEILRELEVEEGTVGELERRPEGMIRREILRPDVLRADILRPDVARELRAVAEIRTFDRMDIRREQVQVTRLELVWEPSLESQNPYYPLWQVQGRVQDSRESTLAYVNAKGDVFSRLTPTKTVKGGGG
jgi:hypothetical protein